MQYAFDNSQHKTKRNPNQITILGDPNLGKIGNQFINENSELFLGEILPGLERNLAEIFTKTANEVVETASYDEMFPNIPPKQKN